MLIKRRELKVERRWDVDRVDIHLVERWYERYEVEDAFIERWVKTLHLTYEGWKEFPENTYLPLDEIPHISGHDMFSQAQIELILVEWEKRTNATFNSGN